MLLAVVALVSSHDINLVPVGIAMSRVEYALVFVSIPAVYMWLLLSLGLLVLGVHTMPMPLV